MARNYYLLLSIALTAIITIGSLISAKSIGTPQVQHFDKVLHFGAYFVLSLSWFLTFSDKLRALKLYVSIAVIVFLYGVIIEGCQLLCTNERQADVFDMLANLGGVLIGFLFFILILKKKQLK